MSHAAPLFRIVESARSSGGGLAVATNLAEASRRHPDVLGSDSRSRFAFVPQNWVDPRRVRRTPYVLMPQNAWPWAGEVSGVRPRARRWTLRVLSELSIRRASGVVRMGDLIPARGAVLGAVLPNVLDEAFETALAASNDAPSLVGDDPCFVSIGSFTTYRGIEHLIAGYAHYRALGGRIPLVIAGPGRAPRIRDDRALDGITVLERSLSRDSVLATFVRATAAIFPSTVETSASITLLEATATCRRVLASDIPGHVAVPGATRCFANGDPTELGTLLIDAEHTWQNDAPMTPFDRTAVARRAAARHTWCDDLANRLRTVAGVSA